MLCLTDLSGPVTHTRTHACHWSLYICINDCEVTPQMNEEIQNVPRYSFGHGPLLMEAARV